MTGTSEVAATLRRAGFLSADSDAAALAARAGDDPRRLDTLLQRRLTGEPLAWITGAARFCNLDVRVDDGVYVPRWHTEAVARLAAERLPPGGTAADLCTGSGAVAMVLAAAHPEARVVASDLDAASVACARANGVEAYVGDLFAPLPAELAGRLDTVVAVVPYVPTPALGLLQRDTFTFEAARSYDGGPDGTDVLRRVLGGARRWLRPGGTVVLELGGDQAEVLAGELRGLGYRAPSVLTDEEGDVRGIATTLG